MSPRKATIITLLLIATATPVQPQLTDLGQSWRLLRFGSPHRVRPPKAKLTKKRNAALTRALEIAGISAGQNVTTQRLIRFALKRTNDSLYFGLRHKTSLRFRLKTREGHCVEYSHLFAEIFNRAALAGASNAKAYVVRSYDIRVLGVRMTSRNYRDHDWILIEEPKTKKRWYVDAAFEDFGLGWNIKTKVLRKKKIQTPR